MRYGETKEFRKRKQKQGEEITWGFGDFLPRTLL
jgi:hypothetical protein